MDHFDLQPNHTNPAVHLHSKLYMISTTGGNETTFFNFLQRLPLQTNFDPKFPAKFHQQSAQQDSPPITLRPVQNGPP